VITITLVSRKSMPIMILGKKASVNLCCINIFENYYKLHFAKVFQLLLSITSDK